MPQVKYLKLFLFSVLILPILFLIPGTVSAAQSYTEAITASGFNPPTSSYNLGTKWTILVKNNVSFSLNYDYEVKPDFYAHSAYINLRREF